jgi:hypothetical protein
VKLLARFHWIMYAVSCCPYTLCCCSCLWGQTSLNSGHQWTYSSSSRWYICMILTRENQRTQRKTCPSVTLSITNPTCADPGFHSKRPVPNCMSHGTALHFMYLQVSNYKCNSMLDKMLIPYSKNQSPWWWCNGITFIHMSCIILVIFNIWHGKHNLA